MKLISKGTSKVANNSVIISLIAHTVGNGIDTSEIDDSIQQNENVDKLSSNDKKLGESGLLKAKGLPDFYTMPINDTISEGKNIDNMKPIEVVANTTDSNKIKAQGVSEYKQLPDGFILTFTLSNGDKVHVPKKNTILIENKDRVYQNFGDVVDICLNEKQQREFKKFHSGNKPAITTDNFYVHVNGATKVVPVNAQGDINYILESSVVKTSKNANDDRLYVKYAFDPVTNISNSIASNFDRKEFALNMNRSIYNSDVKVSF